MSQQVDIGFKGFIAGHDINGFSVVKIAADGKQVIYCQAGDRPLGIVQDSPKLGDKTNVKLFTADGTFKVRADATVIAGQPLAPAYSGNMSNIYTGLNSSAMSGICVSLESSAGVNGAIIEVARI